MFLQACQLRLCKALANFYRVSNNVSDPWDNELGWELTSTQSCERLVAASPRQAVYCSWYGVTCCTPQSMADRRCSAVNTVTALDLPINNLNVSLSNPVLLPSLKTIHGCGMRVLNLEANNLIGGFSDEWGDLDKLTVFNFGKTTRSSGSCAGRFVSSSSCNTVAVVASLPPTQAHTTTQSPTATYDRGLIGGLCVCHLAAVQATVGYLGRSLTVCAGCAKSC
jgi:hypothetical protein